MSFDSRRLLYFLRIVEFGSLSRAAKSLGVAQPALSHHIRLLEESLGVSLLVRSSRGVAVTEEGDILLGHARAIVERLDEAEHDLRSRNREVTGTIRLGLASSLATPLAPLLLRSVRDRHPGIVLHLVEGTSTALAEWVRTERLDLAVNIDGVSEHRTTPLFSEDLYLISCAGALDRLHEDVITFADVIALPLILPTRTNSMRMLIERTAVVKGLTVKPVFEVDGFEPLKAAVAAGLGYSILSWPAIQKEHSLGKLSASRITSPSIRRTIVLDAPLPKLSRAAQAVRTVIRDIVEDLFRSGVWRGELRPRSESD